jgi:hypothetical protein
VNCQGCGVEIPPSRGGPARKWCSERCRKSQYAGECENCGAPTDGSYGRAKAPKLCKGCAEEPYWTRDRIVSAIRSWVDATGEVPASYEWHPGDPRFPGAPFVVGEYPNAVTVHRTFGSWTAAVEAAGLEPRGRRDIHRYDDLDVILARIRNGESMVALSRELGLSDSAVSVALRSRGMTATSIRDAA